MATIQFSEERFGHYMDDSVFIESNRTIHAHFIKRLADFTALDANLDAAFAADWLTNIEAFEDLPSDDLMRAEVEVFTEELPKQKAVCLTAIADLEYYVKKTFPRNKSKLREFGFAQTRKSVDGPTIKMAVNLSVMVMVASDYTAQLTGAGMPAGVVANIDNEIEKLFDIEIKQEYQKRLRIRALENRIFTYNTLYRFYDQVRSAAHVIYRDKPETLQLFEMFRGEK